MGEGFSFLICLDSVGFGWIPPTTVCRPPVGERGFARNRRNVRVRDRHWLAGCEPPIQQTACLRYNLAGGVGSGVQRATLSGESHSEPVRFAVAFLSRERFWTKFLNCHVAGQHNRRHRCLGTALPYPLKKSSAALKKPATPAEIGPDYSLPRGAWTALISKTRWQVAGALPRATL
jgi:hypothetical protein